MPVAWNGGASQAFGLKSGHSKGDDGSEDAMGENSLDLVDRLVDSGLDLKEARVIVAMAGREPIKASEIGSAVQISRMDAYNTLKRLQEKGIVAATVDKPMRFTCASASDVFGILIRRQENELKRIEHHLADLSEDPSAIFLSPTTTGDVDPTFTVLKDRQNIYAAVTRLVADAETEIWLVTGRWGMLHFIRAGGDEVLNEAAGRGVSVRVLATVEHRTLRYYTELDDRIEVRHTEHLSMNGIIVDDDVAVTGISIDSNPVGRGREDSALLVEASGFISAQKDLIRNNWGTATDLSAVARRIEDGEIVEPLKVSLGGGSFYSRLKQYLAEPVADQHPSSIGWTNAILRVGSTTVSPAHSLPTFEALGIDTDELLRAIGRRIGEEIALEVESDEEGDFWTELAQRWQELGMGTLTVEGDPPQIVRVENADSCGGAPKLGGIFCHLDEGILEGIITSRLGVEVSAVERECTATGKDHCHFDIVLKSAS
jgi:predicted hydrocarbon binding protein/sugar-specific transcriptional regulator TrmB